MCRIRIFARVSLYWCSRGQSQCINRRFIGHCCYCDDDENNANLYRISIQTCDESMILFALQFHTIPFRTSFWPKIKKTQKCLPLWKIIIFTTHILHVALSFSYSFNNKNMILVYEFAATLSQTTPYPKNNIHLISDSIESDPTEVSNCTSRSCTF